MKLNKIVSERGTQLETAHQLQHESNINHGKIVLIESKGTTFKIPIGTKCPVCKFRVRGLNHVEGAHHRNVVPSCSK